MLLAGIRCPLHGVNQAMKAQGRVKVRLYVLIGANGPGKVRPHLPHGDLAHNHAKSIYGHQGVAKHSTEVDGRRTNRPYRTPLQGSVGDVALG